MTKLSFSNYSPRQGMQPAKGQNGAATSGADTNNPVVAALRRMQDARSEAENSKAGHLRIASELFEQLGWAKGATPNGSDSVAMRSLMEQRSREQVQRTRAELDSYLGQFVGSEESGRRRAQWEAQRQAAVQRSAALPSYSAHRR